MSDHAQLGTAPPPDATRDAIHVAIVAVTATHDMRPGTAVGRVGAGSDGVSAVVTPLVGVVDPFQKNLIRSGDRVWLLVKPGTVSKLRHEWSHPLFDDIKP